MKRKVLPRFVLWITLIAITAGVTAGSADAQTRRKVTLEASVPFEFVVGNHTFPAGKYTFEMATGSPKPSDQAAVLVVRGQGPMLYASLATDVDADGNANAGHKLMFVRNGDRVYLSKVWRQGNPAGLSIHTAPPTEPQEWEQSEVLTLDGMAVGGGY